MFSYYSPSQSKDFLIPSIIDKIKKLKGNKIKLKNYNNIRDISSIEYITKQLCSIISKKNNGIINCGSGNGVTLEDLALKIAYNKFNKKIEVDKRLKSKKPSQIICNNYKLIKITGIKTRDNLLQYI